MNKLFATLFLVIASLNLQGQDGYVKFLKNTEIQGMTFFKGEIYPLATSTDTKFQFHFSVGTETFGVGKSVEKLQTTPGDKTSLKDNFIKSKDGGLIHIDVSSVSTGSDTIRFISEKFDVTPIVKNTSIDLEASKIGKSFRLIIPNSPTIFYSVDSLTKFDDPNKDSDGDGVIDRDDKCPKQKGILENQGCPEQEQTQESGWATWQIILLSVIGFGIIGLAVWYFFLRRKTNSDEYVYFNGGSLTDFARPYGGLDYLNPINPQGLIPSKYEYDKLNKHDKNIRIQNLVGKRIRVKEPSKPEFGFGSAGNKQEEKETNAFQLDSQEETFVQPTNLNSNDNITQQLGQLERNILGAIKTLNLSSTNSNQLGELRREKTELENKVKALENDRRNSDLKQTLLLNEKSDLETNLQTVNAEKSQIQLEIKDLKEKVIAVEFLKGYSEIVFSYLKYCQLVSNDIYQFFNKINQQNPKQAFVAGHLLMKFQSAVNSIPVGDWVRTVQDIKDSGATTNRQLIRSFAQIQNDNDKIKEFQRLLFSEVLTKYSSSLLILAEAFKSLSRFQGSTDFANEAQNTFARYVPEIVSKARSTGLELKHVSLFESWEKHIGQIEDNGGERSIAYKEINGLEKGAIAEIVSFGVKTAFEDTKTIIILA